MMGESIASSVTRCLDLFDIIVKTPESPHINPVEPSFLRDIKDEHTRFKVWAGNIGAHRTGMSSLQYRLRDSSHIRNQVFQLLQDLIGLLEDATAIISGEDSPWDQLSGYEELNLDEEIQEQDGSPDTELGQISIDVVDVVSCLLRLSVAIRNPAPHDRFVESKLTDASYYEQFDINHVYSKFNSIDSRLAERLGKAISRRRQYLKYRETHHMKLSHGLDQHHLMETDEPPQTIASSLPEHLKDRIGPGQVPQVAILEDDHSDTGFSQTSYATSTANDTQRRVPPLPEAASRGPFECPFCYMIIIAANRSSWK